MPSERNTGLAFKSAQVLPIIYGFVRSGRMRKTPGGKFKRLKKAEE